MPVEKFIDVGYIPKIYFIEPDDVALLYLLKSFFAKHETCSLLICILVILKCITYTVTRTRQSIRYRATVILRRTQIKQYTASKEGGYRTNGNII